MGSGLILLVIVGAWLAVLVPMGLRAHDSTAPSRSGARSDGRVLARRPGAGAPLDDLLEEDDEEPPHRLTAAAGQVRDRLRTRTSARAARGRTGPLPLVVRRRRVLLTLVGLALISGLLGLVGPGWLHALSGGAALLSVLFVVHCRRQALLQASRRQLRAQLQAELHRRGAAPPPAHRVPLRAPLAPTAVLPVHDEPATPVEPVAVPAVAPARHALGAEWQPVPVPLPTYVGKAVAPPAAAATTPGTVLDERREDDRAAGAEEAGPDDLTAVLDRRRAVGGW